MYSLWKDELKINSFGIDDNFFNLGGNSIQALNIMGKISDRYEFQIDKVFEEATIRAIAASMTMNNNWVDNKLYSLFNNSDYLPINASEHQRYLSKFSKIKEPYPSSTFTSKYTSILLLGSTGFLGSYILKDLLKFAPRTEINLIIRASNKEEAQNRIFEMQRFYFGNKAERLDLSKVNIFVGDLTKRKWGLSEDDWFKLSNSVDAILNSAAMVKHFGNYEDFYKTNVEAVRTLLEFSNLGIIKDIHHISTIGILFGEQSDINRTIFTEYDFNIGQKLNIPYLRSKFEAEELLFNARNSGNSINIYRLSGVLFDSQTGVFQKNVDESSAYIFLRALLRLKIVPNVENFNTDISMVDQISEALVRLVLFSKNDSQVYHIMNPENIGFSTIMKWLETDGEEFSLMSASDICAHYKNNQDNDEVHLYFTQLLYYCEIIALIKENKYNILRDKTVAELGQVGFFWKEIEKSQLEQAYQYARKIEFI